MPTSAKVLAAAAPEMDEKLRECLPGHDLIFVRTMGEAIVRTQTRKFITNGLALGYRYDPSPICWPDPSPAPPAITRSRSTSRRSNPQARMPTANM